MRLVGLLLVGLGGLIGWSVLQGQNPIDHVRQLIDLFGHQHLPGTFTGNTQPANIHLSGRAGGNLAVGP